MAGTLCKMLYEEALDLAMYLRQAIIEKEKLEGSL